MLVAHAFVAGGLESESERPLSVGGAQQVAAAVFAGFDYVALGHLHRPQSCGSETVRYAGSLLKYSFAEHAHDKSVSVVDIGPPGSARGEAGRAGRAGRRRDRRSHPAPRRAPPRGHARRTARSGARRPAQRRLRSRLTSRLGRSLDPIGQPARRLPQHPRHRAAAVRAVGRGDRAGRAPAAWATSNSSRLSSSTPRAATSAAAQLRSPTSSTGSSAGGGSLRLEAPSASRCRRSAPTRANRRSTSPTCAGRLLPHHRPHRRRQDHHPRRDVLRPLRRDQRRTRERGRPFRRFHAQRPRRSRHATAVVFDFTLGEICIASSGSRSSSAPSSRAKGRPATCSRRRSGGCATRARDLRGWGAAGERLEQGQGESGGHPRFSLRTVPPGRHASAGTVPEAPRGRLREREQILRALFETGRYAEIELALHDEALTLRRSAEKITTQCDEAPRQAEVDDAEALADRCARRASTRPTAASTPNKRRARTQPQQAPAQARRLGSSSRSATRRPPKSPRWRARC